jgi:mRNA-degrading endonuclease RelE of RelBE toxin-antitoxin system
MFSYNISDELKKQISILMKKDRKRAEQLHKKIREIISRDEFSIGHYKNLKYDLSDYKRVHISGGSFVLLFRVLMEKKHILFLKLEHHKDVYR